MSRFLTNDESRSINPADEFTLGEPRPDPADELAEALAELEATGVELRAERDRLGIELDAARQARRIVELGASEELWRWRFTYFWDGIVFAVRMRDATRALDYLTGELRHHDLTDTMAQPMIDSALDALWGEE